MAKLKQKRSGRLPRIEVIDLFCGIGGLSYGMKTAGLHILAGFDLDHICQYAYETNTGGKFTYKDIRCVTKEDIEPLYSKGSIRVLAGCAPCQQFSSYAFKNKEKDPNKYDLLNEFGRLVEEVKPDIITMENVPAIRKFILKPILPDFIKLLENNGYFVWCDIVYCPDFGIPQTRTRLVLIASKSGKIEPLVPTHSNEIKHLWIRHSIHDVKDVSQFHNKIHILAKSIVEKMLLTLSNECVNISENIDTQNIRATVKQVGWEQSKDGRELLTIKTKRNHLAYGQFTFAEIGKDYKIADL